MWLTMKRKVPKRMRKYGWKKINLVCCELTQQSICLRFSQSIAEVHVSYRFKPMHDVLHDFWTNIANQFDFDHNGVIDPFELGCMLQAIGK